MFRRLYDAPYLLLSLTSLFWAGNIVLGRLAAGHVPPIGLAFLRWVIASAILIPFAWPHIRREAPMLRGHVVVVLVLSLTGIAAFNTMMYWGLQYTPAINALLIQSTGPLMIAFWSLAINREHLSLGQFAGILLSLLGVLVIICRGDPAVALHIDFNIGDLWAIAAMVVYGAYSALLARRPGMTALGFLTVSTVLGSLMLAPLFAWERMEGVPFHADLKTLAIVVYVGVFPSVLAYLCFIRGVHLVGPNRAAPFFHLMPVFGSVLAIAFLGEAFRLYHAVGYALVLSGIVIATLWGRRKAAPLPPE
ncbi:DMT family transporter [Ancylobacter defluvii]|uniref:DMT transporter permease n=1 Tax=Ancylobacter defluvii TaxID=1282440 RepID=A0A9W6JQY5_9HYPH|nr:DMT family transporter [Ancylobacter defluvii]MBS7587434.1 DMT family transporter [Ancylobacter defluvii]GLK82125.1 DMT transporter permease [Ancylobacter defluvii]